jgi:hypothetical protein
MDMAAVKKLEVKYDGQIVAPTFDNAREFSAVIDAAGQRYALLTKAGQLLAWDCDPKHDSIPCTMVERFSPKIDESEKAYEVRESTFDASRPWAVFTNLRSYNRVISRHQTKAGARIKAARLSRQHALMEQHRATLAQAGVES